MLRAYVDGFITYASALKLMYLGFFSRKVKIARGSVCKLTATVRDFSVLENNRGDHLA
jgi:hypothetical protein